MYSNEPLHYSNVHQFHNIIWEFRMLSTFNCVILLQNHLQIFKKAHKKWKLSIVTPFCVHHTMETPIIHLEQITIMTPKVSHLTMHSPYIIPTSQAHCLTIQNMSNIPCNVH
jgi:hypothetical protein